MKRFQLVGVVVFLGLVAATAEAKLKLRNKSRSRSSSNSTVDVRSSGASRVPYKGTKYLAAVSYSVLNTSCDRSALLWTDPGKHLAKALPATRDVKLLEREGARARAGHSRQCRE